MIAAGESPSKEISSYSPEKLQELKNFGRKSADEVFMVLKNKLGIILK